MQKDNLKKYLAEMVGTFVLVAMAVGAAVFSGSLVAGALAFGLAIVAMAYAIGPISGCHVNPAVSFAMWINKKLSAKDFLFYTVFQVIGAIIGGLFIFGIVQMTASNFNFGGMGSNVYEGIAATPFASIVMAFMIEIVLTFVFVFTILGVTSKLENGKVAGIVIGLTLTLVHLIGIGGVLQLTNVSVNPARSLGPAIFAGWAYLQQVWLFILAPLAGALLAAVAAKFFFKGNETEKEAK